MLQSLLRLLANEEEESIATEQLDVSFLTCTDDIGLAMFQDLLLWLVLVVVMNEDLNRQTSSSLCLDLMMHIVVKCTFPTSSCF